MPTEVIMPKVDMDMARGRIVAWHVEEGAAAEKGAPLFDIETDKAAMEVESPASGRLHHRAPEGSERPIGAPVAWLYAEDEAVGDAPEERADDAADDAADGDGDADGDAGGDRPDRAGAAPAPEAPPPGDEAAKAHAPARARATPAARRLAREAGIDLADLAGTGPRGRVQAADVTARAPAAQIPPARARARGGALAVTTGGAGTGTPVVLLHGLAADGAIWRPVERFLDHRPIVRIDLPAHGASPLRAPAGFAALAAELRAAFDGLGLERAHLIGHSLGGALALALADTRARRVASLTLIAPAGLGPEIDGDALAGLLRASAPESLAPWLRRMVADEAVVTEGYARAALAARADPAMRAAQAEMAAALFPDGTQGFDLGAALGRLEPPSRVIWGRRDRILPWRHALRAGGRTALHLFEDLGHMPQLEAPERVGPLLAPAA